MSEPDALSQRSRRRGDIAICLLLGLAAFLVYNANFRAIPASDSYAARYLPFSIWQNRTLVLDPIVKAVAQGWKIPESAGWIVKGREDHFISLYPVVVPVVVAPLYLPIIYFLNQTGWDFLRLDRAARIMEKLSASLIAAMSVMLVYLLLRRRTEPKPAALLTLVFAFGTTTWVISSQALWMHGLAQLLIAATLLLLTGPCSALRAVAAGFLCALIACNRQPDAVLVAGLGLYGLWWAGRRIPLFLAAGVLPVGLLIAYNLAIVGNIAGAYALLYRPELVGGDVLANVVALLFSPTHGLFVFSPFLLFVPLCLPLALRDRNARWLTAAIGSAVILQLIAYGTFVDWRQGQSFGPRWLTDMLPMLFWMLPPIVVALPVAGRVAFGSACSVAIGIQVIGAFWYTGVSDAAVLAATGTDPMQAAWDIRNASFIAELNHPPAPADLFVNLQGQIDLVTVSDRVGDTAERQGEVTGWTLAGNRPPATVYIMLDGRVVNSTASFFERPNVTTALGEPSQSGWKVAFPAHDLAAGEHVIAVLIRIDDGSEPRLLRERKFTLSH